MNKIGAWIKAFRLRTLPLSLSSILMGSFLAYYHHLFSYSIALLAIFTTIFLQVLSNLANDYGDAKKGTDNENRLGPTRAVQSGVISLKEMKTGIIITATLSLISGILLIIFGLKDLPVSYLITFFIIGIMAILAAINYTMGKKPYGYAGLGDLFVFLFFGIVGVLGSFYLITHELNLSLLLPASGIGLFSVAVLNMNNMRDIKNDKDCGKNTMVVKIGLKNARIYHTFLIVGGLFCFTIFIIISSLPLTVLLCFLTLPLYFLNLKETWSFKNEQTLDSQLKIIALGTFVFTLLFGIGLVAH